MTGVQTCALPIWIKATIEVFLEEFDPSQNYPLSISDIEGYETQFIAFEIWDEKDMSDPTGSTPGCYTTAVPLRSTAYVYIQDILSR